MRNRIIKYIDEKIKNKMMGKNQIMKNLKLQRQNIYRDLEKDGGVEKVIREKRMEIE